MFSGLVPGLNSIGSPADEFSDLIAADSVGLFSSFDSCLTLFRRTPTDYGLVVSQVQILFVWSVVASTIVMLALLGWLLYLRRKKRARRSLAIAPLFTEVAGRSTEPEAQALTSVPLTTDDFNRNETVSFPVSDTKYAEELQLQEALLASLLTYEIEENLPSTMEVRQVRISDSEMVKITKEDDEPSRGFCEICLDNKERWQMFRNDSCSHSFCYDCTSKHIVSRIQDSMKMVGCPGVNCKAILDFNACRSMIPRDIVVEWDESLCKSLILESQKLYCPYRDCAAMLVNDSGEVIKEIKCPVCRRSLCALCYVPWHSDFTCEEFQKLNAKTKGKEDDMVKTLAKKKNWMKCPRCKMYVEKTEGCLHIICRCSYEFCYRCGKKWSVSHGSCRQRS